jgi:hypothetical protein
VSHDQIVVRRATTVALGGAAALLVAGCSASEPDRQAERKSTPDPKYLVPQLSDLPPRFSIVPGETFSTPLSWVLADPWSAGAAAVIRRDRVAGYQTSFWSPESGRIECSAAVYRSKKGASDVFRHRTTRFRAFIAAGHNRQPMSVGRIGDETAAFRFELGRSKGLAVAWRYRNVLASCTKMRSSAADLREIMAFALAQQERISAAVG